MTARGAGPLNWRTPGGLTPDMVRGGHRAVSYSTSVVVSMLDAADEAHIARLYEENECGGEARQVVADAARALGVVLADVSAGQSTWDAANMRRVVRAAEDLTKQRASAERSLHEVQTHRDALKQSLEDATSAAELWKGLAERNDATAPVRADLRRAERERDELKRQLEYARYQVLGLTEDADVDDLKATIVSQAREIARLKGEGS